MNFSRYAASCFTPHLFAGTFGAQAGCGACALALLTGTAPEIIAKENGGRHYPDRFMLRFLRQRGFEIQGLTPRKIVAADGTIGRDHILLLSQMFCPNEATWGVIFGGMFYHNFEIYTVDCLSFFNKPVLSAYLVVHPQWRLAEPAGKEPQAQLGSKHRPFKLKDLGLRGRSRPRS